MLWYHRSTQCRKRGTSMADIELVIKVSEEMYKDIQSRDWKNGGRWYSEEWKAIHNGVPLPKGHGKIVDVDTIDLNQDEFISQSDYYAAECAVDNAITIIKAESKT